MLEPEELAALRLAMGQATAAAPAAAREEREATRIALLADDRAAAEARPAVLRVASRWARSARRALARVARVTVEIHATGAEAAEGPSLRDEITEGWACAGVVSGRSQTLLVAAGGPLIEALAARMLGASSTDEEGEGRPPSRMALRLFEPVGVALATALAESWREELGESFAMVSDPGRVDAARRDLTGGGTVVTATLEISGAVRGTLRIVAHHELLSRPSSVTPIHAARPGVEEVLGAVPVELTVELGRTHVTMSELAALRPGAVITLDRFIDDALPVRCQGVIKAHGRAVVSRSAMAVEIAPERAESEAA